MILFIDDEHRYVENVITELQSLGFEVKFCAGVDEALYVLRAGAAGIAAIVADVMMPHGSSFTPDETNQNRETGLEFLKRIRKDGIRLPVILLTNVERGRHVDDAAANNPPCTVLRKREYLSFEIAEIIQGVADKWKS
jgi:CheY-like chemotaxis protein